MFSPFHQFFSRSVLVVPRLAMAPLTSASISPHMINRPLSTASQRITSFCAPTTCTRYQSTAPYVLSKDDKRDFMAVFPDVVRDITEHNKTLPEVANFLTKTLQYNVPGGKKLRGLTVVYSFRLLAKPDQLTEDNVRISQILGWAIEMCQAFFLILDDLVDESVTRRGRTCWYRLPDVDKRAIFDALLVEKGIYKLLKKHISDKPYYLPTLELLNNTILLTTMGQLVDYTTNTPNGTVLEKINMDRYDYITNHKTAYYTFYTPVAIGMYLAGIYDPERHRQAKTVLQEMGRYFQVQDDYLDVFGDTDITGKIGTDIQDGKCSWLAVVALQRATSSQRSIFEKHFGKANEESVKIIKDLYLQMNLPALYATYEDDTYKMIHTHIQQLSAGLPHDLFFGLLERIHGRTK